MVGGRRMHSSGRGERADADEGLATVVGMVDVSFAGRDGGESF